MQKEANIAQKKEPEITRTAAARMLKSTPQFIDYLRENGDIRTLRRYGKNDRYLMLSLNDVRAYLKQRRNAIPRSTN